MKNNYRITILSAAILMFVSGNLFAQVQLQSFRKGTVLISITEGITNANYSTHQIGTRNAESNCVRRSDGLRDPLIAEYGVTNHWGFGFSMGGDIFSVDPQTFYGFKGTNGTVKATTSEVTLDANYHILSTANVDLSLFGAAGLFNVSINDKAGYMNNKYNTIGGIVRGGARARYYFYRNIGAIAMLSTYSGSCTPKGVKENTVGQKYNTTITGYAIEFGLCYKIASKKPIAPARGF